MKRLPLLLLILSLVSGTAGTATVAFRGTATSPQADVSDGVRGAPALIRVQQPRRNGLPDEAPRLERRYHARDGLGFSYPAGWFVETHETGTPSFLTNFRLGLTCCHMVDGQIKVDFWSLPASEAREMQLTFRDRCAGMAQERVIRCSEHATPSAVWGWVHVESDGSEALYAIAEKRGRTYIAVGLVPSGPHAGEGLTRVRDIFRTFRIA